MRVVFMGTPGFAVPCLEQLVQNQYQVMAVYTQPDRPAGRGRPVAPPPVKQAAAVWGIPVVQPASLKSPSVAAQLAGFQPEVVVVAAFGQILPQSVLDIPAYGCINIHFSLLPRWRGASPVAAAVLAGDQFTGVSLMLMEPGLDTGPVLARAQIPISSRDTTGSVTAKLSLVAAQLLPDVLLRWCRREITPHPQSEAEATYAGIISKETGEIDWRLPAIEIWRRIRAFYPWPGAYTQWQGRQLKILEALPLARAASADAGRVVALDEPGMAGAVNTGDGVLGLLRLQLAGKQAMAATEFIRGQRQFVGSLLGAD